MMPEAANDEQDSDVVGDEQGSNAVDGNTNIGEAQEVNIDSLMETIRNARQNGDTVG